MQSQGSVLKSNTIRKLGSGPTKLFVGVVDEESFTKAFEDQVDIHVYNAREFEDHMVRIKEIVEDTNIDWEKRVDEMRKLRSIVRTGAANFDKFCLYLRLLEIPFQLAIKDLRTQVVREACITIAYLSQKLQNKFDHFSEIIITPIFSLLMNSVKIVASSGLVAIKFLLRNVHAAKLIPIICNQSTSKSNEVRRCVCESVYTILLSWSPLLFDRHVGIIQDTVKKGLGDADSEARLFSRRAFWEFRKHYQEKSKIILKNLPENQKKQLFAEVPVGYMLEEDEIRSVTSIKSTNTKQLRPQTCVIPSQRKVNTLTSIRSNSSIDLRAAQIAKVRALYSAQARKQVSTHKSGALLQSKKNCNDTGVGSSGVSAEETGKTTYKVVNTLQSMHIQQTDGNDSRTLSCQSWKSGDTRSKSEETKGPIGINYRKLGSTFKNIPPNHTSTHTVTQKQPLETETVLLEPSDDHETAKNETIGVSTKHPFDLYIRCSNNINEILIKCENPHYNHRKEGLINLYTYLKAGNLLQPSELKRVMNNFTILFLNNHSNIDIIFLDTLIELILVHSKDLNAWLNVLIYRLLNELGGVFNDSIQKKIYDTLDMVRISFSSDVQMFICFKFICETKETHPTVKTAVCNYITKLVAIMNPSVVILPGSPGQVKDITIIALIKIIDWTMSDEIQEEMCDDSRHAAEEAIISLFNLNIPQITLRISLLPKKYRETAVNLIQGQVSRVSDENSSELREGIMSKETEKPLLIPTMQYSTFTRQILSPKLTSPENTKKSMDSENYDKLLCKTSVETQDIHESHKEILNQEMLQDTHSTTLDTSTSVNECENIDTQGKHNINNVTNHNFSAENESITQIINLLNISNSNNENKIDKQDYKLKNEDKKPVLIKLHKLIQESSSEVLLNNFKSILRVLLIQIDNKEPNLKMLVLASLTEMIKKQDLVNYFNNYVELLTLKVLDTFKNNLQEKKHNIVYVKLLRDAEICAATIVTFLDSERVIKVLVPLISANDYPVNLGALKTLNKLIKTRESQLVQNYLSVLMPGLIQAYNNEAGSIRKTAVFCLVALHTTIGHKQLLPYLHSLTGNKLKLLQLYIKKTQRDFEINI